MRLCVRRVTSVLSPLRPGPMHHTNHSDLTHATEAPAVVLYNQTVLASEYAKRLRVSDKHVTLHSVTMTDEGSFTVLDRDGKVRRRNCLNVRGEDGVHSLQTMGAKTTSQLVLGRALRSVLVIFLLRNSQQGVVCHCQNPENPEDICGPQCVRFFTEHQDFKQLSYGGNLKMEMYLPYSNVSVVYRPKSDNQDRVVLDQGVLMTPLDPMLEGRLSVEGSQLTLKKVNMADEGVFKVTDLAGFPVAHVYIEVQGERNTNNTTATLLLLLLLMCNVTCYYNNNTIITATYYD